MLHTVYLYLILSLIFALNSNAQTNKIFWIVEDAYNGKVQCANLDGSSVQTLVANLNMPCGLTVDDQSTPAKIYFGERGTNKIYRVNTNGTNLEEIITDVSGVRDMELDVENRKIYWIRDTYSDDSIQRADMDELNSNIETLISSTTVGYGFLGIGLDVESEDIFWTMANNGCSDKIARTNFSGTGYEYIITYPDAALLKPWDIDVCDSKVYWSDCGLSEDVILYADTYGAGIDTVVKNVDCQYFTIDSVTSKIYWAENGTIGCANLNGTDRTELIPGLGYFLMGIAIGYNVETTAIESDNQIAREYALNQNFPNPFNPSTSISYTIGTSSRMQEYVDISIYNLIGQKILTLVSKMQSPGKYSVQWNAAGFPGGIYLYRLKTGSGHSQSRKLVLLK